MRCQKNKKSFFKVIIPKKAQRDLKKIESKFEVKIFKALKALEIDPCLGKKLSGELSGNYSYRVWPHRIIYKIIKKDLVVLVIRVGSREGVYKK